MNTPKWTMESALELIRNFTGYTLAHGCYLGLTGSVLFRGQSDNDLDVVVYPGKTEETFSFENFRQQFPNVTSWVDTKNKAKNVKSSGGSVNDLKEVWKATFSDGREVDFFFLK